MPQLGVIASRHWTPAPLADDCFALENMAMVGDRGMITTAPHHRAEEAGGLGWPTAPRATPQIAVSAADTGPLQMSLLDEQNLAEITHPRQPRGNGSSPAATPPWPTCVAATRRTSGGAVLPRDSVTGGSAVGRARRSPAWEYGRLSVQSDTMALWQPGPR